LHARARVREREIERERLRVRKIESERGREGERVYCEYLSVGVFACLESDLRW